MSGLVNTMTRKSTVERKTKETQIQVTVNLDGKGIGKITTPYAFFSHMLELLTKHSKTDLEVKATGDLSHHIIEDVGIVIGQAVKKALGKKLGIRRFGSILVPMDESLGRCAIDLSGRPFSVVNFNTRNPIVEDVQAENFGHFITSFATNLKANIHLDVLYGENDHHKIEAGFKALAVALKQAVEVVGEDLPSTKGLL